MESVRQRGCPLFPGEMPLLGEFDGQRERLRLPRLGKHRASLVARSRVAGPSATGVPQPCDQTGSR